MHGFRTAFARVKDRPLTAKIQALIAIRMAICMDFRTHAPRDGHTTRAQSVQKRLTRNDTLGCLRVAWIFRKLTSDRLIYNRSVAVFCGLHGCMALRPLRGQDEPMRSFSRNRGLILPRAAPRGPARPATTARIKAHRPPASDDAPPPSATRTSAHAPAPPTQRPTPRSAPCHTPHDQPATDASAPSCAQTDDDRLSANATPHSL